MIANIPHHLQIPRTTQSVINSENPEPKKEQTGSKYDKTNLEDVPKYRSPSKDHTDDLPQQQIRKNSSAKHTGVAIGERSLQQTSPKTRMVHTLQTMTVCR